MGEDFYPCRNSRDFQLRKEGKLGVAVSPEVLMANINRRVRNFERYFFRQDLAYVLAHPGIGGRDFGFYDMAYLPDSGEETVTVNVRGTGTPEQVEERAKRNLAYKILRRKATHGANLQIEWNNGDVTMSAIPVILDHSM